MTEADAVFAGTMPAIYERIFVPMIFEPFAKDMAERTELLQPHKVLEIAAGTGVVTRAVAARLGNAVEIVATDLSQPMLDLATRLQGDNGRVTFQQADALALPFEEDSFDVAVCQFGVMFFPDKLLGYREARRVLKAGGTYLFAVWDELAANAFGAVVSEVLDRRFPNDPPRFLERTPHGYSNTQVIIAALEQAGFSEARAETVAKVAHADSAMSVATGYCQGNPLRGEIEAREPGGLQTVTEAVASALTERFGQGPIKGATRAHIVAARK